MFNADTLNEAQHLAVTHGEGPLLLLAGPGSGKTFTIIQRILYLLEKGIPPEKLLVITFTRDAALSMQRRFQKQFPDRSLPVNFGTFHSVFYHILKESGDIQTKGLLTLSQKKKIMVPLLNSILKKTKADTSYSLLQEEAVSILEAVSFYKNTRQIKEAAEKLSKEWQPHFPLILEEYEKRRKEEGFLDFDDMVYECRTLLAENPSKRSCWQQKFSHILMDEFQDINPIQYDTVKLLAQKPYNLFAVGDDDQAIYGFRGAEPDCLKRFAEDFQARQLLLNVNYRSQKEIITAAGSVIAQNKNRFSKEIIPCEANSTLTHAVLLQSFQNKETQYEYLVQQLKKWTKDTGACKSCAILFRTNAQMQGVAARLRKASVPYCMKEKLQNPYQHFIVQDIMAYLQLAGGQWSRESFLRICNKPSRYISREAVGERKSLKEIKAGFSPASARYKALEQLERQLLSVGKMSPALAVTYVCKAMGYEAYLREEAKGYSEKWLEWQEKLEWLKEDAAGYVTVREWLEEQEAAAEASFLKKDNTREGFTAESDTQKKDETSGMVQLMTVHGSKGLEFDKVYIPDCNERVFPKGRMLSEEACEEERRIFYVAMTRAAKSLELLYLTGTENNPRLPSRFLNPLLDSYSSTSSSNSQLSRYSSKASATRSYSASSSIKSRTGSSFGSSGFSL